MNSNAFIAGKNMHSLLSLLNNHSLNNVLPYVAGGFVPIFEHQSVSIVSHMKDNWLGAISFLDFSKTHKIPRFIQVCDQYFHMNFIYLAFCFAESHKKCI